MTKYSWSPRMAVSVSKIANVGFVLKNLPKYMYHTYIIKNYQLPDLIHNHVILEVHLVPQDGCKCFQNSEILVCLDELTFKHISYADNNIDQLPGLIHDHIDLNVHLDPQDGLESL